MPASLHCIPIVLAFLERQGHVLISRRPDAVAQPGRWEFPGGKIAPGESPADALAREVWEEIGVRVRVGEEIAVTCYQYPDVCVELHLFHCRLIEGEPAPVQVTAVRWVPVATLDACDFPPANRALLAQLHAWKDAGSASSFTEEKS